MGIPLTPNLGRSRQKEKPFAVFDIEAHKWTNFKVCGWYNGENYKTFRSMKSFLEFAWEQEEKVIYAHFGGIYDFMFVLEETVKESNYEIGSMIPRGSGLLGLDLFRETLDIKGNKIKEKLEFRDSSALMPFSLAKLTKSFGVKHLKGEFDFGKWDGKVTDELLKYLKDDCRGLYECIKAFYEWPLIKKAGPAHTIASQSLKVFRIYLKGNIYSLKPQIDNFVRKSYYGGRTEIFKPEYKSKNKNIYCYDVNSLYPTVMEKYEYPTNFSHFTYEYEEGSMGFYECEVDVPKDMYLPPLPIVQKIDKTEKLIFPTGKFKGVYTSIEIDYARSLGVKIKTGKGAIFKNGGYLFKGYINDLYKMRLEAQAKGDGVGEVLCKLMMNSTYGRFGLVLEREQVLFDDFTTGLKPLKEISVTKHGKTHHYRLMTKKVKLDSSFSNVAISSWVTAHARIYMHKLMFPYQKNLYYSDTDSMFVDKKLKTGTGLGNLKEEYSGKEAVFLLPKTYVVQDKPKKFKKIAMKGFDSKKISKFEYDDFLLALEGDLRLMKVTQDEKMAKMKSAIKKGSFLSMQPAQQRQIRSLYDKRTLVRKGKSWDSKPLHLE